MTKQTRCLRHHEEDVQERLLGGFTDVTPSYIHSSPLHRNLITCFSLALSMYDSFTSSNYILVRSTKPACTAFERSTQSYMLINEPCISGAVEISPNFPIQSGQSMYCEAVGQLLESTLQRLQTAEHECLLWSLQMTAHEKLQDDFKSEVSRASDILKINNNIKQVI